MLKIRRAKCATLGSLIAHLALGFAPTLATLAIFGPKP